MEDKTKLLLLIRLLEELLSKVSLKSEVTFPETQKVFVENQTELIVPDEVRVILPEGFDSVFRGMSEEIISAVETSISKATKELKPEKVEKLSKKFDEIKKVLSSKDNDDVIKALKKLETILKDKELVVNVSQDFDRLLKKLDGFNFDFLEKYSQYGEVKTVLNAKQYEGLKKALSSVSVSVGSSGGGKGTSVDPSVSQEKGLSGTGDDTTITLTSANTAYTVPASAPTTDYILVLSNQSDTNMLWGFESSGTLGNLLLASTGLASMRLAGGQVIYARCASASKVLNYSTKIV